MENNENQKVMDFSHEIFNGKIVPISIKMAIPVFISQLLLFLYIIIDTIFISMIDKTSTALISGVGLIFPVFFLFTAISQGLFTGVSSLIARGIGAKSKDVINRAADSGLFIAVIIALFTVGLGFIFSNNIIEALAGSELSQAAIDSGKKYFLFILPGLAFMLIANVFSGIFQGEGIPKYIAVGMLLSTVVNIILDPILIFVFKMGIAGASLATSIAIILSALYYISIIVSKKSKIRINWSISKISGKLIKEIIYIGLPYSLSLMLLTIGLMILNNIVSSISENAMNSWVLVIRIDQLLLIPAYAFANAALTLAGQNYGRNNFQRVKKIYHSNVLLGIIFGVIFALLYILFSHKIFGLFTNLPEVINKSVTQVRILSLTYIGIITTIITVSTCQAIRKPITALVLEFIRIGILTIPLTLFLIYYVNYNILSVYLGVAISNIVILIIAILWGNYFVSNIKQAKISD